MMVSVALFCTLFFAIFNYTLPIMAGPYIVGELGGSNDTTSYCVAFYALGNAVGIPLGAALLNRIGPSRMLHACMLLFALISLAAATAPTYPALNIFRFFQGFVGGPIYALVFYFSGKWTPPERKDLFTSITITIFTVTPVLGACWGGWMAFYGNWSWVFYINIPLLLILTFFLRSRLKQFDEVEAKITPFDWPGYTTFAVGVLSLTSMLIMGQELDWFRSNVIITLTVLGTICLAFFILWELSCDHPIIELRLLKTPGFSFALFHLSVLFSSYFGMVVLLSLWLKLWVNYTPEWIALLIGTMAIAGLFPIFLFIKKIGYVDTRFALYSGIAILAISCFHTMYFNVDINFGRIAFSRSLAGFGLAFFLVPLFRLCFNTFPQEKSLSALTFFQIFRALSSGLGASVYNTVWQRRQVFYHDRLGSRLTTVSPITQEYYVDAKEFNLQGDHASAEFNYLLDREATSLALDDCFYLMAWILVGLFVTIIFTFYFRKGTFRPELRLKQNE